MSSGEGRFCFLAFGGEPILLTGNILTTGQPAALFRLAKRWMSVELEHRISRQGVGIVEWAVRVDPGSSNVVDDFEPTPGQLVLDGSTIHLAAEHPKNGQHLITIKEGEPSGTLIGFSIWEIGVPTGFGFEVVLSA